VGGISILVGIDLSGGFVLRHNTIVQAPNDIWTSLYRTMHGTGYNIQMWADTTLPEHSTIFKNYRVYNNIFGDQGLAAQAPPTAVTRPPMDISEAITSSEVARP